MRHRILAFLDYLAGVISKGRYYVALKPQTTGQFLIINRLYQKVDKQFVCSAQLVDTAKPFGVRWVHCWGRVPAVVVLRHFIQLRKDQQIDEAIETLKNL